jgi:hypothetical protein
VKRTAKGRQMKAPIVEEVRKHRMEHTRKFHGDLAAICADLRRVQKESGHVVVRLSPKRIKLTQGSGRRMKRRGHSAARSES